MTRTRRGLNGRSTWAIAIAWSVLASTILGAGVAAASPSNPGAFVGESARSTDGWVRTNLTFNGIAITGNAFDAANGEVYVLTQLAVAGPPGGVVNILSGANYGAIATLPMNQYPVGPVIDPMNGEVYVASNSLAGQVIAIDPSSNRIVANLTIVHNYPESPILDTRNGDLYVPWGGIDSDGVILFSGSSNQGIGNVSLPSFPVGGAFDSLSGDLYLGLAWPNEVVVISGISNSVVATLAVAGQPGSPVYDPANGEIYVAVGSLDEVLAISGETNQVVKTLPVGSSPGDPVLDRANGLLYVSNTGSNNVSVISGGSDTVIATIPSVPSPHGIVYDPVDRSLYVASWSQDYSGELCVISVASWATEGFIPLGATPDRPVLNTATGDLLVSDFLVAGNHNAVSVVAVNSTGLQPATCEPPTAPAAPLPPLGAVLVPFAVVLAIPITIVSLAALSRRRQRRKPEE